ncbi:hypothetical protein WJX74_003833 [Apatococcus lobatus]|uniref:Uncharacterized protein n=1 Tax=Apatococcus lobatus TaxID=904363 RepID=A0AAW1QIG6_9CHLO
MDGESTPGALWRYGGSTNRNRLNSRWTSGKADLKHLQQGTQTTPLILVSRLEVVLTRICFAVNSALRHESSFIAGLMGAVGGQLKAKTSSVTVLWFIFASWQGSSAANAGASGTHHSPEPSGSPQPAPSVNSSPPMSNETNPPLPILSPPPPSPSPPPPPGRRFPDVTCPPLERVPLTGPTGHTYYTCLGFAGVFCVPGGNTDIDSTSTSYHFCNTPYVSTDDTYDSRRTARPDNDAQAPRGQTSLYTDKKKDLYNKVRFSWHLKINRSGLAGCWVKNPEGTSSSEVDSLLKISSLQRLARQRISELDILEMDIVFEMIWRIPLNNGLSRTSKTERYIRDGKVVEGPRRDGQAGMLRSQLNFTAEGHVHIR